MVTCQLLFVQQYQLGSAVMVLNIYIIHNESHLGFNNNDRTLKRGFPKNVVFFLTLSSSPLLPTFVWETFPFDAWECSTSSVFVFSHSSSLLSFSSLMERNKDGGFRREGGDFPRKMTDTMDFARPTPVIVVCEWF